MANNTADVDNKTAIEKKERFRKRAFSFVLVGFTIVLTIGIFFFALKYPDTVNELAGLGYAGAFIVSLVSSASIILPVPGSLAVFPLATTLNPVLLALAASTGGIFGEISGYMAGFGGHGIVHSSVHKRAEGWMKRWGSLSIFVFAAVPLIPFDIAGVVAGALKYPLWKFLLVGWAGKSIKFIALVYAFIWGWDFILRYIG